MLSNTPPHEMEDNFNFEDAVEVYDITDGELDDLDQAYEGDDEPPDGDDDQNLEEMIAVEEGDEVHANPIIYEKHKGSVFCCAISPDEEVGASGGEDDMAYVWDVRTGNTVFECAGHKDSVTECGFSHDGVYLATGDMAGLVQVWRVATKQAVFSFETDDLNWLLWHHASSVLLAGTVGGCIWLWLVPQGRTRTFQPVAVAADAAALSPDGLRLCVGYRDGSVRVLDLKTGGALACVSPCHAGPVTAVSAHRNNALFVTGATDGMAKFVVAGANKEVATLLCSSDAPHALPPADDDEGEASASVEADGVEVVSFCPSAPAIAVTATINGVIMIWDVPMQTSRYCLHQGWGVSSISWHPTQPLFAASGLDGVVRVIDARSAAIVRSYKGHRDNVIACAISKGGNKLVSCSDDGTVRILSVGHLWN